MKLYYSKGACSLAVRITLNEIGVSCDYELVNLKTKKTESGLDYLTINPKGSVPALELATGEILTENAAIQQYLATEYKATSLLPPIGDLKRYRVLEWLSFISSDVHKSCAPLFHSGIPEEIKDQVFKPLFESKLDFLNTHLGQNEFLLANQFTLADGYLFVVLRWLPAFGMQLSGWPHLVRFSQAIKTRKSVQSALEAEGLAT